MPLTRHDHPTDDQVPQGRGPGGVAVGQQALPAYHPRFRRKDFTQPQLFATLALKALLNTGYRGVAHLLDDWIGLRAELGVSEAPHLATLGRAAQRLLK